MAERSIPLVRKAWYDSLTRAKGVKEAVFPIGVK